MSFKDDLLVSILDCGYADLSLLEHCEYDMYDIVDECKQSFDGNMNINNIVRIMFDFGLRDIESEIRERILELEADERNNEEQEELDKLIELDVYDDIESFHNYLDTSIWIAKNKEVYIEYLQESLDRFYENTGFEITY